MNRKDFYIDVNEKKGYMVILILDKVDFIVKIVRD